MEKLLRRVRGKEKVTMADPSCSVLDLTSTVADDDHLDLNVDDLVSTWEIIDPSDEDHYDDDFSLDDTHDHENDEFQDLDVDVDVVVDLDLDLDLDVDVGLGFSISHLSSTQLLGEKPLTSYPVDVRCDLVNDQSISKRYEEEEKEEDEYEYEYEYDLDDELVPKSVGDRFGRERLRKRACPRMNKSKKLAHHYNRPGCVHGKHGLGVKHILI